jgi:hypothetical protein
VHALVPATWLSCVHPKEGLEPSMAATVDQIAASHIGQDTPWPSLEIATAQGHGVGSACERGYGCSYSGTLSFRNASTPLPVESNPRQLFLRLFGQGDSLTERRFLTQQTASLLDMISGEVASLSRSLGPQDQRTLHDYLDSVREIERRIQNSERGDLARLTLPEVPGATSQNFDEHLRMMFDLVALAAGQPHAHPDLMIAPRSASRRTTIGVQMPSTPSRITPMTRPRRRDWRRSSAITPRCSRISWRDWRRRRTARQHARQFHAALRQLNMSNSNAHNQYPPTAIVAEVRTTCVAGSTSTSRSARRWPTCT